MRHSRPDYNRIQDPDELIPEDEPVFLLRAQDVTSPTVVRYWAEQAEQAGADAETVQAAREWADEMETWQRDRGAKVPDRPSSTAA